jgi:hypothetical protein
MTLTVLIFILAIFLYEALGIWGMIWAQGPHTVLEPVLVVEGSLFCCWRRRPDSTWVWISAGPHLMDLLSQQKINGVYLQDYTISQDTAS